MAATAATPVTDPRLDGAGHPACPVDLPWRRSRGGLPDRMSSTRAVERHCQVVRGPNGTLPSRPGGSRSARLLTLFVGVAVVAAACSGSRADPTAPASPVAGATPMTVYVEGGGTYASVSPAQLAGMLAAKDFVLVNVHVPFEGDIDGTDLSIPYDQIASRTGELPAAKDAKIFVYCRSGRMSTIAAEALVGLGYTNVWELDGGMIAWEAAGYPLVQRSPG